MQGGYAYIAIVAGAQDVTSQSVDGDVLVVGPGCHLFVALPEAAHFYRCLAMRIGLVIRSVGEPTLIIDGEWLCRGGWALGSGLWCRAGDAIEVAVSNIEPAI